MKQPINKRKLTELRKHYDLYDAGKWHDPAKRDAYISHMKETR